MVKNLMDYFAVMVDKFPAKVAIIDAKQTVTYRALDERSNGIAWLLLDSGVQTEEIIPLVFERRAEMIIAMLGVLKAGCAFLPISVVTPPQRKQFILTDSRARFVISQPVNGIDLSYSYEGIKNIVVNEVKPSRQIVSPPLAPNHLAYVMYTSGSTGKPKGVMIEQQAMLNLFLSLITELTLTENEQILALTDYTFDISLIELLMPLMLGATIVLTDQGTVGDGFKIKQYLQQHAITLIQATPITWEILLKQGWQNDGTLKLLVGGEKFSTRLAKLLGYCQGNVWNMYGPTETTMWSLCYRLKSPLTTESVPLGKPLANTTMACLDEQLNPVNIGQEGELYLGGMGLARGYLNNPELTQEKFIIHPKTQERLYKTGDHVIAYDETTVCFVGRTDEQIKLGGIRIEAGEIEHSIEQVPFVKKAVVKTHEQPGYYKSLAAYVEIDEAKAFDAIRLSEAERTDSVQSMYDAVYRDAGRHDHDEMNTCGWQSSFTQSLLSAEELKASYDFINTTMAASDLSRVLEIGCGTGSFLLQHIDQANHYTAVEISQEAIDYIQGKLNPIQKEKVAFKRQSAIEVQAKHAYSCVIVNSVIQYFPSIQYLITVLTQLVLSTKDNGTLIIGDVRSLELLEVFLLKKMSHQCPMDHSLPIDSLYYKSRESELILSPYFFYALRHVIPRISHVDIQVKHGIHPNELNYFRYDAILHIHQSICYEPPITIRYDDLDKPQSFDEIVAKNPDHIMVVDGVPNVALQNILQELDQTFPNEFKHFSIRQMDRMHPESGDFMLNFLPNTHEKFVLYHRKDALNQLTLHFYPKRSDKKVRCVLPEDTISFRHYCREPFNPWLQKFCFDQIRACVNQYLVAWVTPSTYVWVEKWPVTSNGKLDKKRLALSVDITEYDANQPTLSQLRKIWLAITGENAVLNKAFVEQGISSLYTHFFLATINETFGIRIHYDTVRQHNNLIKLATYIDELLKTPALATIE